MLSHIVVLVVSLTVLLVVLVSCDNRQTMPARTSAPTPSAAFVPAPITTPSPVTAPTPPATPTFAPAPPPASKLSYLTEEIPPCTPAPGSSVDPCEPGWRPLGEAGAMIDVGEVPFGVDYFLESPSDTFVPHIVLRGTYLPGSVRCTSGDRFRPPSYVGPDAFRFTREAPTLNCYADVRVNAYVLGSGPSLLTVQVAYDTPPSRAEADIEERRLLWENTLLIEGGEVANFDVSPVEGREAILFIGPAVDISVEVWQVFWTWNVERREDGTVIAVHPDRGHFSGDPEEYQMHRSKLEIELPAFTQAVTTAHQARVAANGGRTRPDPSYPMLVTDANRLREFFSDPKVGGYDHPDGPPSQPPPPCGLAVPDQANKPDLMRNCITLLEIKDTLRGTATLNWMASSTITTWEGVTLNASSTRVAELELDDEGLNGTIPAGLGELSALVTLDLSDNELTGEIPAELGRLSDLQVLSLSGNSLTGCIPLALRSVATNDLSSLNLLYCRPPAPENLTAGSPAETSVPLSWGAVPNAGTYRVEYRLATSTEWLVDVDNATTTSHVVDDLDCGTDYLFRVSGLGSGTVYAVEWSDPSEAVPGTTTACVTPTFSVSSYTFPVREDAAVTTLVGMVSATDPNDDAVTYAITAGNGDGKFAIATSTGAITVAGELDYETTPSYTLTVGASDIGGNTATATVAIEVTDVLDETPPAPGNVDASLSAGVFTVTWDAVTGAADYEAQYRTGRLGGTWTSIGTTTATTLTYSPTGGPPCGTSYDFRVRAYGDGTTYVADWGMESEPDAVETEACNRAPEFATSTYTFMVAENATTTDPVGTVSANDPDSDPVSYAITSGNSAGKFAIATGTGDITVAGALDHESVPSYTLIVEARDDRAGVATTTVEIEVTDVAEDAPSAPVGLGASLADDIFTVTWSAVTGALVYELQQQVSGSADGWDMVATTTGVTETYSPSGGAECGTTYEFRVRAYGDATVYAAVWSQPSEPESHTTGACNRAPVFGASFYTLTISENAATGTSAGAISATDPDGDPVSHSIIVGNGAGKFTIATSTGAITLTGTVDPDAVAFYALTVEASDDEGETSTALVGVAVLLDECSNGTVVPRPRSNPRLVRDCSMLLAARDTLAGDASLDWSADTDIDDWQGVRVERGDSPYVRVLFLPDAGLTGSIPAALGGLADLRRVDLDYNSLTGGLPRELGSLYDVELIYLNHNNLTGTIPAELGQLRNLKSLFLTNNDLTGGIPPELGNLRRLTELIIEENSLTGGIPVELGALSNLKSLYLSENNLTGGIPPELGKLSNLKYLLLEGNPLGGEIPTELGGLTRLEHVYLRHNGLIGEIPSAWGDLPNLTSLYLNGNSLTGCIPAGLRDVEESDLEGLGLDYCS